MANTSRRTSGGRKKPQRVRTRRRALTRKRMRAGRRMQTRQRRGGAHGKFSPQRRPLVDGVSFHVEKNLRTAYGGLRQAITHLDNIDHRLNIAERNVKDAHTEIVSEVPAGGRFTIERRVDVPMDNEVFGPVLERLYEVREEIPGWKKTIKSMTEAIVNEDPEAAKLWAGQPPL